MNRTVAIATMVFLLVSRALIYVAAGNGGAGPLPSSLFDG